MCGACALTAMTGATGLRVWLATRVPALQDPRRMRRVTAALFAVATLISSVALTGGGAPPPAL